MRPRLSGVGGQRLRWREMQVALDRQAQPAAHGLKLRDAHGTGFRTAQAEIAQAEAEIGVLGIEFREKPRASGIGREELHDRQEVRFGFALFGILPLKASISEQGLADVRSQEFHAHHRPPLISVSRWVSAMRLQAEKSICRAKQKCLRSERRSMTASSQIAGLSPRAHIAALRADRAVATRRALGSGLADIMRDMVCFLSWLFSTRKEKPGLRAGGVNGLHGHWRGRPLTTPAGPAR